MKEFAGRTHQEGVPALARDYAPAAIDLAAMAVRVERVGDMLRVADITWGGDVAAKELLLSFGEGGPTNRIVVAPRDARTACTWTLWEHVRPMLPSGRYGLRLRVGEPLVRTRRLDTGYYRCP